MGPYCLPRHFIYSSSFYKLGPILYSTRNYFSLVIHGWDFTFHRPPLLPLCLQLLFPETNHAHDNIHFITLLLAYSSHALGFFSPFAAPCWTYKSLLGLCAEDVCCQATLFLAFKQDHLLTVALCQSLYFHCLSCSRSTQHVGDSAGSMEL